MSFKGEIALGALNSKYKYGFTVGDIYRVQGAGNLVPNNLAVANGAFVEWTSNGWEVKKDMQYAVSKTGESLDDALNAMQWKDVTIPPLLEAPYTVPVHNHEHVVVPYIAGSNIDLTIQCDETCDEATVTIQANPTNMQLVVIKRGTSNMKVFGRNTLVGIDATRFDYNYLYSSEGSLPPTDFSEIATSSPAPLEDVEGVTGDKASENYFAIEIKKNYAVVHYV